MLLKRLIPVLLLLTSLQPQAQNKSQTKITSPEKPKIVIGLVVDQMRWDYLYKFQSLYGNNGFKKLLKTGFSCDNTLITHMPTYTAVGHTGIYTGSVPALHGIVGNNWYDRSIGKMMYCTEDTSVEGVGTKSDEGKMSPKNLITNTITDELRLSNNFQSKVIGVSLKDRGAILPAGHSANAAYWFDEKEGKWISSTYYMSTLPNWVNRFNEKRLPDAYMSDTWNTLLPLSNYTLSSKDEQAYEGTIPGEKSTAFPHQLSTIKEKKYTAFKFTPFGNSFTLNFAKVAMENEQMGKGAAIDFITISLSSTDYIGHTFGPNSVEIEDTYLRLDRDIATFINYLDSSYGKNNYLLFLTADHGVAHNPSFLNEHHLPGETYSNKDLIKELNDSVFINFQIRDAVTKVENAQVYINDQLFHQGACNPVLPSYLVHLILSKKSFVCHAYDFKNVKPFDVPEPIRSMSMNSYYPSRSGDIQIIPKPNDFDGGKTGTTHGLWNPYDAHIPLVWYGWKINPGRTHIESHMTDIAATLAALLNIQMPNGCVGKVIEEVVH